MIDWKCVVSDSDAGIYRTPVPGGWLILTVDEGSSTCFYPDPKHLWDTEIEDSDE